MLHEDDFLSLLSQLQSSFLASHTFAAMQDSAKMVTQSSRKTARSIQSFVYFVKQTIDYHKSTATVHGI